MSTRQIVIFALAWLLTASSAAPALDAPLADAAEKRDVVAVRSLLERRADVNQRQVDGMTALHWAAYHDDLATMELLTRGGADAKAANRYGVTALSLACANGNGAMVELLLTAGADPNTTLRGDETVLMTASRTGRLGPVQALLAGGANVGAKDWKGQTALMWAAADGHLKVVEALIKAGADFRTPLDSGFTPLMFAVREGRAGVVRALLDAGDDVNGVMQPRRAGGKAPRRGTSPLVLAIENGHFELALALLEAGADPNDQRSGFTPLHIMVWVRKPNRGDGADGDPAPIGSGNLSSLQFIRELVARGADVNTRLKKGRTRWGSINKTLATPFFMAAKTADVPLMKLLVEFGADPLLPNEDGCTPLMMAAGVGTRAPREEAGTEPEAIRAVKLTLKLGADVNAVDDDGETAMHGAAYKSFPNVVQLLAESGHKIDVWNRKNKRGWTPLMIAEGHRPGNFKPSAETIAAIHRVMLAAGLTPPKPTPRVRQKGDQQD